MDFVASDVVNSSKSLKITTSIMSMTTLRFSTLQRKLNEVKKKLKGRMKVKKNQDMLEKEENPSEFIWIGGFKQRLPKTPEPMSKRKLSFSDDDEDAESTDDENILSPATIELQMAWYKNFHLRFFEDEVTIRSPAKKFRGANTNIEIHPRKQRLSPRKPMDFSAQIKTFRAFSEPNGPDFKIYDDYYYPEFPPTPKPDLVRRNAAAEYRNLVPGNTPAPPLPPRNSLAPKPPVLYRTYKQPKINLNSNHKVLKKSYSTSTEMNYSYLL